jgi:hypothetical protein
VHVYSYALQSLSVRDFDEHATCMVGKYEVHVAPKICNLLFSCIISFPVPYVCYWKSFCFFRRLIRTIDAAAVLLMCNLYRFLFSVLVLLMILSVPQKPFPGMNASMLLCCLFYLVGFLFLLHYFNTHFNVLLFW